MVGFLGNLMALFGISDGHGLLDGLASLNLTLDVLLAGFVTRSVFQWHLLPLSFG